MNASNTQLDACLLESPFHAFRRCPDQDSVPAAETGYFFSCIPLGGGAAIMSDMCFCISAMWRIISAIW